MPGSSGSFTPFAGALDFLTKCIYIVGYLTNGHGVQRAMLMRNALRGPNPPAANIISYFPLNKSEYANI